MPFEVLHRTDCELASTLGIQRHLVVPQDDWGSVEAELSFRGNHCVHYLVPELVADDPFPVGPRHQKRRKEPGHGYRANFPCPLGLGVHLLRLQVHYRICPNDPPMLMNGWNFDGKVEPSEEVLEQKREQGLVGMNL